MFWGGLKCPLFVLCPPMRISSDAFQREAEPDPVCEQWRPPVGVVLWSQSHPHLMSADTQSHAKYLNLTSFTKTYCISYSINIMCCYKYGESWQRKWILPAFKFNNTAWRTCWMWSPKPPAASSSSTKSPLTTGCSSCTTSLPPVYFSSPQSWHLPSEYHLYVD